MAVVVTSYQMGRTIPTFSMAIEHEKRRWRPFRYALYDKSDRKNFDKMFDIPKLYTSACSNLMLVRWDVAEI